MSFFTGKNVVIASNSRKPSRYNFPALVVTCTKNKIRMNSAAGELIDVGNRENIVLVHNGESGADRQWGVVKGYTMMDETGNPIMVPDRMTAKEEKARIAKGFYTEDDDHNKIAIAPEIEKVSGFRMSITNGNALRGAKGHTLEGTDAYSWQEIGGTTEENMIYEVSTESVDHTLEDGTEITIYPLIFKYTEDKSVRGDE